MMQIKQQTKEEKIAMYMKCTKQQLIGFILANEEILESIRKEKERQYLKIVQC